MEVICEELVEIRNNFGDERRTEITAATHDISMEDLINEEDGVDTVARRLCEIPAVNGMKCSVVAVKAKAA